jgi:transcriptional regulator with XRE-family HTH domain
MAKTRIRQRRLSGRAKSDDVVGLDPTSPTPARIQHLLSLGLDVDELAEALDVTPATVRNWLRGSATPRRGPVRVIDDLRRVVVVLAEAGIAGSDAAQWLRSRQGGSLENDCRPLDVIREDPVRVLASAHGVKVGEEDEEGADLHAISR